MKNKKYMIIGATIVTLVAVSYGMVVVSEDILEDVSMAKIDVSIVQESDDGMLIEENDVMGLGFNQVSDGQDINQRIALKVEDDSKNSYVAMKVDTYVKDGDDNQPIKVDFYNDNEDWIKLEDNDSTYFYYRYIVAPGMTTSNLFDGMMINVDDEYQGQEIVIDYDGIGVQALAGKEAIQEVLGRNVTVDDTGTIVEVK